MDWIPAGSDIAFYQNNGWFVTPEILPSGLLDRAEEGIRAYYEGHRDRILPDWTARFDWKPEDGNVLKLNNYLSLQINSIRDLVHFPLLGRTAAYLAQTPAVRLYKDSVIIKPPSLDIPGTKVGWHTDRSYWMMCTAETMLTAWIPFQDSSAVNGALAVIEGSHQWPITHDLRTFGNQDSRSFEEIYGKKFGILPKRVVTVKRGQVSFHDCRLLHGSMENNSSSERKALAIHLQPDENRYRIFPDENDKPLTHLNDYLCKKCEDGTPDYCDQEIFPKLWRQVPIKDFRD